MRQSVFKHSGRLKGDRGHFIHGKANARIPTQHVGLISGQSIMLINDVASPGLRVNADPSG